MQRSSLDVEKYKIFPNVGLIGILLSIPLQSLNSKPWDLIIQVTEF